MIRFFTWMQKHEGWKTMCAIVYIVICIFDFILIPAWFGVSRTFIEKERFLSEKIWELDPSVQIRLIDAATFQHEPLTLQGAGMFHLAFGALLTGSAISRKKDTDQ